jgi:endonuclease-8
MPEGDTIYRAARTLRQTLAGREVTRFDTTVPELRAVGLQRLLGETVDNVQSRGKHLLHWFQPSGLTLHTHMRMTGSWHVYRAGERWRKPQQQARVVLGVELWTAVCFSAPVVELLSGAQVARHPSLASLGPDALASQVDLVEARRRLDARGDWTIAEALLDQRVLAGVGNVYKCEVLFLHATDPWLRVIEVNPDTRDGLLATAVRLLRANAAVGSSPVRTTTGDGPGRPNADRLNVYGRAGRACPRCKSRVRVAAQGAQARLTYWCPGCQGAGGIRS